MPVSADTRRPLGRRVPTDFEHVAKYPLSALRASEVSTSVPVVLGVNWYRSFDTPVKQDGRWYIGLDPKKLGSVRGGHAICAKPDLIPDVISWWDFYNQGREGACVGFAASRCMSLLNRKRYTARWLWDRAKETDDWLDTNPGDNNGTSVRAAMDILRDRGHVVWQTKHGPLDHVARAVLKPKWDAGIAANRWATTVDEMRQALLSPRHDRLGAVPLLNSWGRDGYPHVVWLPYETLARLLLEYGEATLLTDR